MTVSTYASEIVALLNADSTLAGYLPGGVHEYQEAGRKGINRVELFQAFFPNGIQHTTAIIFEDKTVATNEAIDMPSGYRSTITPIRGWILDDGDAGYDNIDLADHRMYQLLHGAQIAGAFQILWNMTAKNKREPLLDEAAYYEFDCRVYGFTTY